MSKEKSNLGDVTTVAPSTDISDDKINSTNIPTENINENNSDSVISPTVNTNEDKISTTDAADIDLSKVKTKDFLKQKYKKCNQNLKKALSFILIGIICFCAGFFTDRALIKHNIGKNFNNRSKIQRNLPGNFRNNNKFKSNDQNGVQAPQQSESKS